MTRCMRNGSNYSNTIRPLYISKIIMENTGDESYITTPQILEKLETDYGINPNRQYIKYDVEELIQLGFEIEITRGVSNQYRYAGRAFDTAELRILIDAVVSSKSLSRQKSLALAKKITGLSGGIESYALARSIDVGQRVKSPNESIYYITDAVNKAISLECKIAFFYYEYTNLKTKRLKNRGRAYYFSPYRMLWDGDFYYMIGYSDKHKKVASFRVDRIEKIPVVLEAEEAVPVPADFDLNDFINSMPRMLDSSREEVTLEFDNSVVSAVYDRFGYDVEVKSLRNSRSSITVLTATGPVLYSWIAGFAGRMKLVASEETMAEYRDMLTKALSA